ncbi:MAG: multiple sugar transport system permease protein [Micromonosporaceae bacterium]
MTGRTGRPRRRSPLLTVVMLAVLCYFLLPLCWLAVASTKDTSGLFSSFGLWFHGFHLFSNVHQVLGYDHGVYLHWLANTVLYAGVSAVGAALLATLGGYGFAKFRFAGAELMFRAVLGSVMVPATALAVPIYLLFSKAGLVDTPQAVIIPSLLNPLGLYLMRVYAADAVDDKLLEAARIDGAGELRIFLRVAFRLLVPGFITVLLLSLVSTWNNYFLPLIVLNTPSRFPLTVGLARWNAAANGGSGSQALFNLVITGSLLSIIPLIAVFLLLQRYWQSGIATGSVR